MRKIVEKSILGKSWVLPSHNETGFAGVNPDDLILNIVKARGIDESDLQKFLNPTIKEYMPNPNTMIDMELAGEIISESILNGETIAVYGDYDVDGITSTAVFVKYLKQVGANVIWHLPTREGEGYGLNNSAIDSLIERGAKLIITVDCGISGISEIEYAKSRDVKVVVTDHHSPDKKLPNADAIVNPKRNDDTSNLSYLAGVGVAFFTVVMLHKVLKEKATDPQLRDKLEQINLLNYMDFVALGTICDTMPLIELNRAFVATGLKILSLRQNLGLSVLMNIAGVKKISVYTAGFMIGPRLNAAGRIDSASPALELLLTDNPIIANDLANKLNKMNDDRIDIQNVIMNDAMYQAKNMGLTDKFSLFLCGDNWHGGVMGIIAGRLKEKYNLPTCVASRVDNVINGSGRSIDGVDLGKIIHEALALGYLSEGGGHAAAAGFTLPADKEKDFCEFLEKSVEKQQGGEKPIQELRVDLEMDCGGADMTFLNKLSALEPFGQGNPEPTLVLNGGTLSWTGVMGDGNHLRGCIACSNGNQLNFVGFNMMGTAIGDFLLDESNTNTKIKLLGKLKENEYKGRVTAQFILEDLSV